MMETTTVQVIVTKRHLYLPVNHFNYKALPLALEFRHSKLKHMF